MTADLKSKFAALIAFAAAAVPVLANELYRPAGSIPIGGEGGWDYVSVDGPAHKLYVSHGARIVVLDLVRNEVAGGIDGVPGSHGIALAPKLGLGFASSGRENFVATVDLATLETLRKTACGQNPDAVLFDPSRAEVYAFNGRSKSATIFSASDGMVVATVDLGGKPEFAQSDDVTTFVNIEDTSEVATIDHATRGVTHRWKTAPGEEPTGLEFDREHHRLFVGCSNECLQVLDSRDGHAVATVPAGKGIDAVAFDPANQLVFTSNGRDGTVTVIHEDTPDKFTVVQTLKTEVGARTMIVDPVSHRLYLPSARFQAAETGKRPTLVPDTLKVLVYELVRPAPGN
jgi:DNA-binding beta-propeller fold protein YncE